MFFDVFDGIITSNANPLTGGFVPASRGRAFHARLRTLYHKILLPLAKARLNAAPLSGSDLWYNNLKHKSACGGFPPLRGAGRFTPA